MITKQEMVRRLRKSVNGADVMTLTEYQRFMGLSRNTGRSRLKGVPRIYGKYYMVEDLADHMLKNLEE